jgi:hypothetical protein
VRALTTAIDKGPHKVPEGHSCTLYALAPGTALRMDDVNRETEVVTVDALIAKKAKYAYSLRWVEGRTVAVFDVNGAQWAQPVEPDPVPKRKRAEAPAEGLPPPPERPVKAKTRKPLVIL